MKIIKITQQNWKSIDPTKTGVSNMKLVSENEILFNTSELIIAESSCYGGTKITYKRAIIDVLYCKEDFKKVSNLILK